MNAAPTKLELLGRERWQHELAQAFVEPGELLAFLGFEPARAQAMVGEDTGFAMRVPRAFAARMRRRDPSDPLLRQVLPALEERAEVPGFTPDPLREQGAAPGLLHKYRSRALLILRGGCAINCRYCFRRHFPYADHGLDLARVLDHVRAHPEIDELILSGGDPLLAKDAALAELIEALAPLPQLRRLRVHTRLPITIPSRITPRLVELLGAAPWPTIVVFHVNHARELDAEVDAALARLRRAGVTLLNQSVLLRGVNDDAGALIELSERLFAAGVLPYYLHLLDRVAGAAHFEVDEDRARALLAALHRALPGFLIPRLVREVPGEASKLPVDLRLGSA